MAALTVAPTVSLDGEPLPSKWQEALLECKAELELDAPAQAMLRFADPGYALTKQRLARLGRAVTVSVPQSGTLATVEVTAIAVEQREEESPELVLTCLDRSHRMGRGTRVKTYLNTTYSDIVSDLARQHGLVAEADSTGVLLEYVLQVSSDLTFLSEMAARSGFHWWVDGNSLHFKKPGLGKTVELKLGSGLISFSVEASADKPGSVEVHGWDRDQQQQLSGTASTPTLSPSSELASLVSAPDRSFGSSKLVTAALAGQTQDEVDTLSKALLDLAAWSSVRAVGLTEVRADLRAGSSVRVLDAGPLTGVYPISRVEHTYRPGRGFMTRFWSGTGRLFADNMASRYPPLQGPATHHPGLVVGQVTSVNDPHQAGRVKVRFPGLDEGQESAWGRVLAPGGGSRRGGVFIPEVGDEVLVGFEHGDPRQPVILGGLYGSRAHIPKWPVKEGKVASRQISSRLGHVIELSDGEGPADQFFLVELAGQEHSLKISKQETVLSVPSGQPVTIKAGETQVALSSTGDVSIKGTNVSIEAQGNLKLSGAQVGVSADAELQLQGQAQASMKGALLQLEAEASASLKGAIVQIN